MLSHNNVGCGEDVSIFEMTQLVAQVAGFEGKIITDPSKPDGTMRKLMDVSRLTNMGWRSQIQLEQGTKDTYSRFLENSDTVRV